MKWKELAAKIAQMTPEEQEKPAMVWGEEIRLAEADGIAEASEDMYQADWLDDVYSESDLSPKQIEDYQLVCKKGMKYLNV